MLQGLLGESPYMNGSLSANDSPRSLLLGVSPNSASLRGSPKSVDRNSGAKAPPGLSRGQ